VGPGLLVGKVVGVSGAAWLAVRLRIGAMPHGMTQRHVVGAAAVAGIGFTVSLFVAGLAYPGAPALEDAAKLGIPLGSVVAAAAGSVVLASTSGSRDRAAVRQASPP
jgi:Na+:H+ antiporter, NhaA family